MCSIPYKKIVVKVSGEVLGQKEEHWSASAIANQVAGLTHLHRLGVSILVVVGGGNLWRGRNRNKIAISSLAADRLGMYGTLMNSLVLAESLANAGLPTQLLSTVKSIVSSYTPEKVQKSWQDGKIVVVGGGAGRTCFTTDTAALLFAIDNSAELVCKGTKVDGVYSSDPLLNPTAIRYRELSAKELLTRKLGVIDLTALALCQTYGVPILVYKSNNSENILNAVMGDRNISTLIHS